MSIALVRPDTTRDMLVVALNAVLAVFEAINPRGPNVHNAVLRLRDVLKEFKGKESDTVENRAWVWATKTLTYATTELLAQTLVRAPYSVSKGIALEAFLAEATKFEGVKLDESVLINPGASPVFGAAFEALPALLLDATTATNLGVSSLNERFARALRGASIRVYSENTVYFQAIESALTSLSGEGARRDAHWARHHNWISAQFTDEPIFSPDDDETTPLASVYIRLRGFWNDEKEQESDRAQHEQLRRTATVVDLHKATSEWLQGSDKLDFIRVVAGGPGSGKSSFARCFAHETIREGSHKIAFIRLQHTRLSGSLYDDIGRYFMQSDSRTSQDGSPGLPANPLDWRKDDPTPLLLIFDGLDELSSNDEESKRHSREFILLLQRLMSALNSHGTPAKAVVLGRNIACEEAMNAAAIPLRSMINVAPIAPMSREVCRLGTEPDDSDDLFDVENLMPLISGKPTGESGRK